MKQQSFLSFPAGFLWGAATSSHQVEGNTINDWSEWEQSEQRLSYLQQTGLIAKYGKDNFISGNACNHYALFSDDFDLACSMGHNATRLSLEWSRIEPEEGVFNQEAIRHYQLVIQKLHSNHMEPFVTLWHWTLPLWLARKGGTASRHFPQYFTRFAQHIVTALPDVRFWITINEPMIYTDNAYLNGNWPPQQRNPLTYLRVLHNLIAAHRATYHAIKNKNPNAQIGASENMIFFEPLTNSLFDRLGKKIADHFWNGYFFDRIKDHYDFIGLNHYFHNRMSFLRVRNENKVVSDMGWELYPPAIYYVLKSLQRRNKPIYITENGLADAADQHREWFITEMLKNVHRAISEGVDVRGYLHWSLMDNFEWDKGFWPRFGLLEVNYKTFERTPRKSALAFAKICRQNGLFLQEAPTEHQ